VQIKAADERASHIAALERLLDRPDAPTATRSRIEGEIRRIQAGAKGEANAAYEIELWFGRSKNYATIHDLRIEVDGLSAQIDHLIIGRLADIWVCESKHFAEGVSVNEHGEWTRWWHGRQEGIPSPIEQNARHIHLLRRVFDDGFVPLPRRLGLVPMKPEFQSLVLVSNNARIGRPRKRVEGLDQVIKAERLRTHIMEAGEKTPAHKLARVMGTEGLERFARDLAALHRPGTIDWEARFGLPKEVVSSAPTAPPAEPDAVAQKMRGSGHRCASCGAAVSFAVVKFCWNNKNRFGGAIYCIACQASFAR
jgi:hypothetical protein